MTGQGVIFSGGWARWPAIVVSALVLLGVAGCSGSADSTSQPPEARIAVIGGTHVNDAIFQRDLIETEFTVETPVGESPTIQYAQYDGIPFYYIHMHGGGNWLGTWAALYQLGVEEAVGGATAGAINTDMEVYDYVIPHDFIDMNYNRPRSIPDEVYRDPDNIPLPRYKPAIDTDIRGILLSETRKAINGDEQYSDIEVHDGGVVMQDRSGRFETVAEIEMMDQWGGDLVTHNIASEMVYSRMLGINYANMAVISNPAEGKGDWDFSLMKKVYPRVNPLSLDIILASLPRIAELKGKPRVDEGLINHPEMTSKEQGSADEED